MTDIDTPYEDLLRKVLETGALKSDRTGTGTHSVFGCQIRYNLSKGFPLLTTKRVAFKAVAVELLWFLSGSSNIKPLLEQGVHIWSEWPFVTYLQAIGQPVPVNGSDEWKVLLKEFERQILEDNDGFAEKYGELGRVYGTQWRQWQTAEGGFIDQISTVIDQIRNNPDSRRIIVSAWNVAEIEKALLPPCHVLFQFYVADGKLSCQLYQRSADMFLGVPFNIASYALLTHLIAAQCDLEVGDFVWTGGDTHVYRDHVKQVEEQLSREPRPYPTLHFARKPDDIFGYTYDDIVVENYDPHPPIKAQVSV